MLERNEGTVDRIVRAILSAGLLWAGLSPLAGRRAGLWKTLLALTGAVLGFTALTGHCSLYNLFRISTIERKS